MNRIHLKFFLIALTWFSLLVLGISFYLEYQIGLKPCPLCLMQRYLVVLLCVTSLFISRWLQKSVVQSILGAQLFFALAGVYFAGRQLWLESLPMDQTPACMPSLEVLLRYFPWQDVFRALFLGSGDCGNVEWTFLGLSLAVWSLVYFSIVFIATLYALLQRPWNKPEE